MRGVKGEPMNMSHRRTCRPPRLFPAQVGIRGIRVRWEADKVQVPNMRSFIGKRAEERRGATAVEFALCSPVLFLIVFGIIEYGRVLMVQNALTSAAREGVRTAALATTTDTNRIDAAVGRYMDVAAPGATSTITCVPSSFASIESGTEVSVDVSVSYSDVSWMPTGALLGDIQLRGTAVQVRE